jgi:hypothetical protein
MAPSLWGETKGAAAAVLRYDIDRGGSGFQLTSLLDIDTFSSELIASAVSCRIQYLFVHLLDISLCRQRRIN